MGIRVIECTDPTGLFRHYEGQSEAQPAYIELDLREGVLLADYNAEIGNGQPFSVFHGFDRRYGIPVLTAKAANEVMHEIAPLAERILSDWEEQWNGSNHIARLGQDAEEEINAKLGVNSPYEMPFDAEDMVGQWDIGGVVNGSEAEEYEITAETTDERLKEIEEEILTDLAECDESPVAVCEELEAHLRGVREELAEEDKRDLYVIVAAPGDRVDGAELAEVDRETVDAILAEDQAAALTKRTHYGPDRPDVLVYLQTEDPGLDIPEGNKSWVLIRVASPVADAVAAVERPAS